MQSTIALFGQLIANIPPLFPDDLRYQMKKDFKEAQSGGIGLDELEKMMVKYGYALWPWRQAFKEFLSWNENQIGEQFFVSSLPENLQERYLEYRELGLTFKDFHSGRSANYFNDDEWSSLAVALLDMHKNLRDFAAREVVGLKKEKYLKKVQEFDEILEKIKNNLNGLKKLSQQESDHVMLANEISARVEAFEHGLCLLAPELSHEDVGRAHEFFIGRKQELNRLRGIHETIEIDFYSE
jgi:hypothetical protein